MIRVVISGAGGRMGRSVLDACRRADDVRVVGAVERPGAKCVGVDAGLQAGIGTLGVPVCDALQWPQTLPEAVIDFSSPQSTVECARRCAEAGVGMVSGTTGLDARQQLVLRRATERIALVFASNMSVGVALCQVLSRIAAQALGEQADVEIIEAHHAGKQDAPSGTALQLGEVVSRARAAQAKACAVYGRSGKGQRRQGSIGYASIRAGDIMGEHTVLFALPGERIEIMHRAGSRDIFAAGAVRAARWIVQRPPGLYDMQDVLQLQAASAGRPPLWDLRG